MIPRNAPWRREAVPFLVAWAIAVALLWRGFWALGRDPFVRYWPFYLNYFDQGLVRRAFFGTVLYPINSFFLRFVDAGVFAHVLLTIGVSVLAVALPVFLRTVPLGATARRYVPWALALSPAFLPHLGYELGGLDVFLVLVFVVAATNRSKPAAVAALSTVGVLLHEIYFVAFVPATMALVAIQAGGRRGWLTALKTLPLPLLVFMMTYYFGSYRMGEAELLSSLERISPLLARKSPFVELTAHATGSLSLVWEFNGALLGSRVAPAALWSVAAYGACVLWAFMPRAMAGPRRAAIWLGVLSPLALCAFGTDIYRWVSFSLIATAVMGLCAASPAQPSPLLESPPRSAAVLTVWLLLGPLGAYDLLRPWPVFQAALERMSPSFRVSYPALPR